MAQVGQTLKSGVGKNTEEAGSIGSEIGQLVVYAFDPLFLSCRS